jgi:hypothetical protein
MYDWSYPSPSDRPESSACDESAFSFSSGPREHRNDAQEIIEVLDALHSMAREQLIRTEFRKWALASLMRSLEEFEAVEGGGKSLAGLGKFISQSAETDAGGVGGAAMVEAVTVDEQEQRLRLGRDVREGALEVKDADQARVVRAGSAVGPALGLGLAHSAVTERGAVLGPLAKPAHG